MDREVFVGLSEIMELFEELLRGLKINEELFFNVNHSLIMMLPSGCSLGHSF